MYTTISDLMEKMPDVFIPEKAIGVDAVVHFIFTGGEPGEWTAIIKESKCSIAHEIPPFKPTLTFMADSADSIKMFTGELDGLQAFMQGKIKLIGDLTLAMKLTQMFKIHQ